VPESGENLFDLGDFDLQHGVTPLKTGQNIEARNKLPENGMPAIQMGLGHVTDEKLGSRCVGTRIGHGKGTCFMLQFRGSLIIDFPARPAGTIAIGIATLGHESLYDAMENQSIVKARIRQMS